MADATTKIEVQTTCEAAQAGMPLVVGLPLIAVVIVADQSELTVLITTVGTAATNPMVNVSHEISPHSFHLSKAAAASLLSLMTALVWVEACMIVWAWTPG